MNTQKYITAREAEECKKVVAAFNELYNQTDILVINSGEHGFVLLKYDNYILNSAKNYNEANDFRLNLP